MKRLLSRLHTETFVLDLEHPLEQLPVLQPDCLRKIDNTTLEVDIDKNCSMNSLFEQLSRHGIEVLSMRNKTNRLEQLFLRMLNNDSGTELLP